MRSLYRAANAIFWHVLEIGVWGGHTQVDKNKCMPILLYGLVACPLTKKQISTVDFVINRFFMKLFDTSNMEIVKYCQEQFNFKLPSGPSVILAHRTIMISDKLNKCDNTVINKKVNYRRGTAQRATLVNSCYVSQGMGARKVSNTKCDLQGHSTASALVPFVKPHFYDFLLVFHCNYVSILHRFRDIINYFPKFKAITWLSTHWFLSFMH